MGSTCWSTSHYEEQARLRAATGKSAFAYDSAIRSGTTEARVHEKLNPFGVKVRESRDSDAHPTSHAVAVLFDVTGSMREVPRILQANLPKLMGLLIRKSYLEHPQILIGAIGDATCDRSPLQVGQFESGNEIENDLANLHLEGGGGGQQTESYELAMYFLARHTAIDCFEKRGRRGYLFVIGDEMCYPAVKRSEVKSVIGDEIPSPIMTPEIVQELERLYDVYFVLPNQTHNFCDPKITQHWAGLLGQNVLRLEDPAGICELIASTIGLAEGAVDLERVENDLVEAGTDRGVVGAVSNALVPLSQGRAKGTVATLPDSGAGSGLATF